jgi:uncharacterized repeat protein (TIGR03847 family)
MRDLGAVERFAAGADGPPGQRTFFLQVAAESGPVSFLLEKAQVAALSLEADKLLQQIGFAGAGADVSGALIDAMLVPEFRVAEIHLQYREAAGTVSIIVVPTVDDLDPVTFDVTPGQLDAAARDGGAAVRAGRPRCPRCGLAMDPDGHPCPATNGDLRHHRP